MSPRAPNTSRPGSSKVKGKVKGKGKGKGKGNALAANMPSPDLDSLDLSDDADLRTFVTEVHRSVRSARRDGQGAALAEALRQSRDAVLARAGAQGAAASVAGGSAGPGGTSARGRAFRRLPSNGCPPPPAVADLGLVYLPCGSAAGGDGIAVRIRTNPHQVRSTVLQVASPPLSIESARPPLPTSSATIFLRAPFASEDEKVLRYVPYFGEDDEEDVISDAYSTEHRENLMEFGPEYEERDTNDEIDETLRALVERAGDRLDCGVGGGGERRLSTFLAQALAEVTVERVAERYKACFVKPAADADADADADSDSKSGSTSNTDESDRSSAGGEKKKAGIWTPYLEAMDSYRNLFCRRCFTYDCNMHGNLPKADAQLQCNLAGSREREGYWERLDPLLPEKEMAALKRRRRSIAGLGWKRMRASPPRSRIPDKTAGAGLTPLQASVCRRAFVIFQGDAVRMAQAMGADLDAVRRFVDERRLRVDTSYTDLGSSGIWSGGKNKNLYVSMRNYKVEWLQRIQNAEIHPFFLPCDHDGPCDEDTCSCVKNAFFCTKHCVWGERSRNFFRGCACTKNCRTKSCPCFAAKRECDPDLCRNCGACCDPPNRPATKQMCRNDNISMRRHRHLLLAESSIKDAGFGIYTKHALKKGDFVHEYLGEVISQEEAERRGCIYDKVNRSYLFNLASDYVVDASRKGNKTRFFNHSSKPNCETKMVTVNGDPRIGLYAKCDIEAQSELFFDYRYDVGMDNDLIIKPAQRVDWMKDSKMANKVSKKRAAPEQRRKADKKQTT